MNIKSYDDFIFELRLTDHYKNQYSLKTNDMEVTCDGGVNIAELKEKISILLRKKDKELMDISASGEKKITLYSFGDIQVKKGNEIFLPEITVMGQKPLIEGIEQEVKNFKTSKREHKHLQLYKGSVFVAVAIRSTMYPDTNITNLLLFNRIMNRADILSRLTKFVRKSTLLETGRNVEFEQLGDGINYIDMDISVDEYREQLNKEPDTVTPLPTTSKFITTKIVSADGNPVLIKTKNGFSLKTVKDIDFDLAKQTVRLIFPEIEINGKMYQSKKDFAIGDEWVVDKNTTAHISSFSKNKDREKSVKINLKGIRRG